MAQATLEMRTERPAFPVTEQGRVLIIAQEGTHRGALAASRALSRAGWLVGCGSNDRTSIAGASRGTRHWHRIPSPAGNLDGFVEAVNRAVADVGYEVIMPGGDAETLALSATRDRILAHVPYPAHANVIRAFDKLHLATEAAKAGLGAPRTALATDSELERVDGPVVIKARLHWAPGSEHVALRLPTALASGRQEAVEQAAHIRAAGGDPVVQQIVAGPIMHCHAAMDRSGRMITCVKQLSEPLTMPPQGGTRVRSRTVPLEPELGRGVELFLRNLGWYGFASLQFIQPDDGPPQLIDFNGRLSMSLEQSIAAGTNFPDLWGSIATGREYGSVPPPRLGVRFQWLEGDLQRALTERRGGLVHDVVGCLRYARGAVHGVWRRDDVRPGLRYLTYYLRRIPKMIGLLARAASTWAHRLTASAERAVESRG